MDDHEAARSSAFRNAWVERFSVRGVGPVRLDDSPLYPLARTVGMPAAHPYPSGAIGLRLHDLVLQGLDGLTQVDWVPTPEGIRLTMALAPLTLVGRYDLEAKPDPVLDLDTGGNLLDLPPEALRPAAGGGASGAGGAAGPADPQVEQWLETARAQRQKLGETENGAQLMALYNQHNEVYEEVFRTSPTLPANWRANGVTKAMAGDTHSAVLADAVVNQADKDYGGGVTYNGNAFVQQLNVAVETMSADPAFDPFTPIAQQALHGPYWQAAKAALAFGKGVNGATGNAKDRVHEMKPGQVYDTVGKQTGGLPAVSDDEAKAVFGSASSPGAGGGDGPAAPGWIVIDEDDRRRVRQVLAFRAKARAEDGSVRGDVLFSGAVDAELGGCTAQVDLVPMAEGGFRATRAEVAVPAFALNIDDDSWTGAVAAVARARLAGMLFIRSLLHSALTERLEASLAAAAAHAYGLATGTA